MVFAAKEAYEIRRRARLKREKEEMERVKAESRAEGRAEGRTESREQIRTELEKRGLLTPEIAKMLEE